MIDHVAGRQRAERRVEVVEARIDKLQRHHRQAKGLRDSVCSAALGAVPKAHPEQVARLVE